jgi:hypothetical protein
MVRRVLPVLYAALGTAYAGAAGFSEAPHSGQLVLLAGACLCAVAYEMVTGTGAPSSKKDLSPVVIAGQVCTGPHQKNFLVTANLCHFGAKLEPVF